MRTEKEIRELLRTAEGVLSNRRNLFHPGGAASMAEAFNIINVLEWVLDEDNGASDRPRKRKR